MDTFWGIARTVLIAVLLFILLMRMFEDRFIFFPDKASASDPEPRAYGLAVEDVFFQPSDGVQLHGWYVAAPGAAFTFLYFHGNAGNLSYRLDNIDFLHRLPVHGEPVQGEPVNVFAVDYRGYGRSQGRPTEAGLYRDAEAAYDYLVRTRSLPPNRIVALGQSLGVPVAVELAVRRPVAGLILEAGFPSAPRVASRVAGWLPGIHLLMRNRFDAAANLRRLQLPVLVAHCTEDPVIPYDLGEELFRAANEPESGKPKTFVRYSAACHEPLYIADPEDYARRLRAFLAGLAGP